MPEKRIWRNLGVIALSLLFVAAFSRPSYAPHRDTPKDGCLPGFWKTHPQHWVGSTPTQTLGTLFNASLLEAIVQGLSSQTLLDTLSYPGGTGLEGAARTMLREATAGVLNAAHPSLLYAFGDDVNEVRQQTNDQLRVANKDKMANFAALLDVYNSLGCPLN